MKVMLSLLQGPNLIISQPDELLDSMSDWCKEHHGKVSTDLHTRQDLSDACCLIIFICCVSQDWLRPWKTATSLSSKRSTSSCPSFANTRHLASAPSQVTNGTALSVMMLKWKIWNNILCGSSSTGNSVHADKKFLDKYMPQFMRHLHYRIIDVSTIKELCRYVTQVPLGVIWWPVGRINARSTKRRDGF